MAKLSSNIPAWLKKLIGTREQSDLQRNSLVLITSQFVSTGLGFLFWVICAHLFKPSSIGLATAILSFATLIATLTSLGLANTIIRFLATSRARGQLITGAITASILASALGGLIGLAVISVFVPKLGLVNASLSLSVLVLALVISSNLSNLLDSVLLGLKNANAILVKSTVVNGTRIVLPFFLVGLATTGLVDTYALVWVLGIIYAAVKIRRLLRTESFKPSVKELLSHRRYALGNYLGGMFGILPSTVVPLIILSQLGASPAAYYYMPAQVAGFLAILSSSVSQSLIAEASQTEDSGHAQKLFRAAFLHLYRLLIPAAVGLSLIGWFILRVYGQSYAANGYLPLVILAAASLFVGANWLGDTWLNIKKRSIAYVWMNAINAILVVTGVAVLARFGLAAAALGYLAGQLVSAVIYVVIFARDQLTARLRVRTKPLGIPR